VTASTTARELYEGLRGAATTRVLDVRNEEEFARWKVEGPGRIDALNLPYFAFIETEEASVGAVRRWLGGRPDPLVVVCAHGGSSELVAEILRGHGIDARNLAGGMAAWGSGTVARPVAPAEARVWQIHRFGKGCLSYVVASGSEAIVVDPHRGLGDYLRLLEENRLAPRAVFDTHLHADHVSGAAALAAETGAAHYAGRDDFDGAAFPYLPIEDRAPVRVGGLSVKLVFLSAPGHTPGSTAFLVGDALLLTGDTLFVGDVGRPDLAGRAAEWGRELHRTLHRRFASVPDDALVLPAHSAGPEELRADGVVAGRLGTLRRENPSMLADEEAFLERIVEAARPAPEAYDAIREINLGARAVDEETRAVMELGRNECALSRR
jgi:glyoxylase-like metal-dependent hydrolase (beta-lactamase superfamily II)